MFPTYQFIHIELHSDFAAVILNRPEKRNALHHDMVKELLSALHIIQFSASIRAILIRANGSDFSSGADLQGMQEMAAANFEKNLSDAELLAELLYLIYTFPKPVIALTHGAAMGGALGILAAADVVFSENNASFALPEVKIGLVPAMISPYLIQAIGQRWCRYYCLTGEVFSAETALHLQLIHRVVDGSTLLQQGMDLIKTIVKNPPTALSLSKTLMRKMTTEPINTSLVHDTASLLARVRTSVEAQEGIQAFVEKRAPKWRESE